ncbi:MAG: tol-pal system protein YbgF [Gammaproteobacteria bacterium]|nr:tol-pal system protein YbgF [Gammaproteobacteria bacterium]
MKHKRTLLWLVLLMGIPCAALAAQAPVVDLSRASQQDMQINQGLEVDQGEPNVPPARQNETMEQRVVRLERQLSNLTEMNYPSKLEKMQQDVQQLHGQIEVQNHDLTQLKEQVRNFYQDLDQRITKPKQEVSTPSDKKSISAQDNTKIDSDEAASPISENNKTKELQTYETAFSLLNKKDYEKATLNFQNFIKDYPNSSYTVNAHYWLGEIFYLKNKPELANKEFQTIIANYPDNPKVGDAMLKTALIAMDAGNYSKARQNLIKVQKQFPGTTAAKIAALRLKEIKLK